MKALEHKKSPDRNDRYGALICSQGFFIIPSHKDTEHDKFLLAALYVYIN